MTDRLRRMFPRHVDVLALCDEADRLQRELSQRGSRKPKRDRASYMRDYRSRKKSNG